MAQQIVKKTRHLQKHDIEANWLKAINFKPMPGEIIVYDKDEKHNFVRTKIGDGETNINDLPFVKNAIIDIVSLPIENINQEAFYRVLDTIVYDYGDPLYKPKINYVNVLPEEGENILDPETDDLCFYYNISEGLIHCYVNEEFSMELSEAGIELPYGWYDYQDFLRMFGNPGFGIVILPVTELPASGMPALMIDEDSGIPYDDIWGYYSESENEAYCYVDRMLSQFVNNQFGMTIPIGWYPYSQLSSLSNVNYQGIFTKEEDIPSDGVSILIKYELYTYNNNWHQVGGAQIQADWSQWDDTQPDYIKNKPFIATPDWNVVSGPGVILNKPCGEVYAGTVIYNGPVECSSTFLGEYFTTGRYGYSPPKFLNGIEYRIVLGDIFEHTAIAANDELRWDNKLSFFNSNRFELFQRDFNGSYNLQITINKSGSYQISPKYLPEGAVIGKQGETTTGEIIIGKLSNK